MSNARFKETKILRDAFTKSGVFVASIKSRDSTSNLSGDGVRTGAFAAYSHSAKELEEKMNAALPDGYTVKVTRQVRKNFFSLNLVYTVPEKKVKTRVKSKKSA